MVPETPNFEAGFYGLPVPQHAPRVTGREPLEVVASEFLGALRSENRPEIDHYVRQHPDLADEIRELFPVLAALEDWKFYRERTSFEHRSLDTLTNEIFGNFRIVREVGRGGMGIVFEGQEQTTKRRIAIKVIPFLQSTPLAGELRAGGHGRPAAAPAHRARLRLRRAGRAVLLHHAIDRRGRARLADPATRG